jgi:hypothetical protein
MPYRRTICYIEICKRPEEKGSHAEKRKLVRTYFSQPRMSRWLARQWGERKGIEIEYKEMDMDVFLGGGGVRGGLKGKIVVADKQYRACQQQNA